MTCVSTALSSAQDSGLPFGGSPVRIHPGPGIVAEGNTTAGRMWSQSDRRQLKFSSGRAPGGQKMSPHRIQPGPRILAEGSTAADRTWSQ